MENKDKASNPHPEYAGLETKRDVYRSVYGGTDSIRKSGKSHLPEYPAEVSPDYAARLAAATIDGIVLGGVETLVGSAFEGEIDISGVKLDAKLLENIDNKGNSFNIFARDAFRESFEGFSLILVDMPTAVAEDAEQEKQLGLRPYLNLYCAGNVINWRYQVNPVSKQLELVLLVLKEISSESDGAFGSKNVTRYRVFRKDAAITWQLWIEDKQANKETQLILADEGILESVNAIPVAFVGDVMADPKLLVESRLEIKAYQKESSFDTIEYLSVPTFTTKGYDKEEPLKLGASAHLKLPADTAADAFYVQIDSTGLEGLKASFVAIKQTIKSRVNYLLDSAMASPDKTATEVVTDDKNKQARLVVWSDELKDALETALMYMGQFLGMGDDAAGEIILRTKWTVAAEQAAVKAEKDEARFNAEMAMMKADNTIITE